MTTKRIVLWLCFIIAILMVVLLQCKRDSDKKVNDVYREVKRTSSVSIDTIRKPVITKGHSRPKVVHKRKKNVKAQKPSIEEQSMSYSISVNEDSCNVLTINEDTIRGDGFKIGIRATVLDNVIIDLEYDARIEEKTISVVRSDTVWMEKKNKSGWKGMKIAFGLGYAAGIATSAAIR